MEPYLFSQYHNSSLHPSSPSFKSCTHSSPITRQHPLQYPTLHIPCANSSRHEPVPVSSPLRCRVPRCAQSILRLPTCRVHCTAAGYSPSFLSSPLSTPSTVASTPALRHRFYDKPFLHSTARSSVVSPPKKHLAALLFPRDADKPVLPCRDVSPNRPPVVPNAPQPPAEEPDLVGTKQPKILHKEGRAKNEEGDSRRRVGGLYSNCPIRPQETPTAKFMRAHSKIPSPNRQKHRELRRRHSASSISSIESLMSLETPRVSQGESPNEGQRSRGRGGETKQTKLSGPFTGAMAMVQRLNGSRTVVGRATRESRKSEQDRIRSAEKPRKTQQPPRGKSIEQVGERKMGGKRTPVQKIQHTGSGGHILLEDNKLELKGATTEISVKRHMGSPGAETLSVSVVQGNGGGQGLVGPTMKDRRGGLEEQQPPDKQSPVAKLRSVISRAGSAEANDILVEASKTETVSASSVVAHSTKERCNKKSLLEEVFEKQEGTQSATFRNLERLQEDIKYHRPHAEADDNERSSSAEAYLETASPTRTLTTQSGEGAWTDQKRKARVPHVDGFQKDANQADQPSCGSRGYNMGKLDYANEATRDIIQGVAEVFDRTEFCFLQPSRSHIKATPLFSDGGPVDTREVNVSIEWSQSQNHVLSRAAWELTDAVLFSDDSHDRTVETSRAVVTPSCSASAQTVVRGRAQRSRVCVLMGQGSPQPADVREQLQQYGNRRSDVKGNEREISRPSISECFETRLRDNKLLRDVIDKRWKQIGELRQSCAEISRHLHSVGEICHDRQQPKDAFRKAPADLSGNKGDQRRRPKGLLSSLVSAVTERAFRTPGCDM
eukprot:GHVS01010516.1.p1 GENE.GHVS01010516.1~~GHVS01010516.1.p1  ORF type:complete len:834 (+),score=92.95 GHVS01010516.1:111-2612(+)